MKFNEFQWGPYLAGTRPEGRERLVSFFVVSVKRLTPAVTGKCQCSQAVCMRRDCEQRLDVPTAQLFKRDHNNLHNGTTWSDAAVCTQRDNVNSVFIYCRLIGARLKRFVMNTEAYRFYTSVNTTLK
jgi:hypothetical protein